jgi:hypothetical protein
MRLKSKKELELAYAITNCEIPDKYTIKINSYIYEVLVYNEVVTMTVVDCPTPPWNGHVENFSTAHFTDNLRCNIKAEFTVLTYSDYVLELI